VYIACQGLAYENMQASFLYALFERHFVIYFNTKFFVFRLIKAIFGYQEQKEIEVEIVETWFREEKQSKKFLPDDRK
jgi:hypothetical protein